MAYKVFAIYCALLTLVNEGQGITAAKIWNVFCDRIRRTDKKVALRKLDGRNIRELWFKTFGLTGFQEISCFCVSEKDDLGCAEIRKLLGVELPETFLSEEEMFSFFEGNFSDTYKKDKDLMCCLSQDVYFPANAEAQTVSALKRCIFARELLLLV